MFILSPISRGVAPSSDVSGLQLENPCCRGVARRPGLCKACCTGVSVIPACVKLPALVQQATPIHANFAAQVFPSSPCYKWSVKCVVELCFFANQLNSCVSLLVNVLLLRVGFSFIIYNIILVFSFFLTAKIINSILF